MIKSKVQSSGEIIISLNQCIIIRIPTFAIGKRKRSTRERSIECELEKISLNASPEDHPPTLSTAVGCDMAINMGLMNLDSMDLDTKQL